MTSWPSAESFARSSARSIPSVTKWYVVPPSISTGSRGGCVTTNTSLWYGGLSPHQPFHCSSPQSPPPMGPNMLRPITPAPMFSRDSSTIRALSLTSPPCLSSLQRAKKSADGQDVMLWGGAQIINQYLAAGLLDELELHIVPVLLGAGARLFDNLGTAEIRSSRSGPSKRPASRTSRRG